MSTKKYLLRSSDGDVFEVDEAVIFQWTLLEHLVGDGVDTTDPIPFLNITNNILRLVIQYSKKHAEVVSSEDLKEWDAEFVSKLDQSKIFDLVLASSFLNIPSLLDLTCQTIADMIAACRDEREIREKFEIVNDFTPDEQEKTRRENQWCFQ